LLLSEPKQKNAKSPATSSEGTWAQFIEKSIGFDGDTVSESIDFMSFTLSLPNLIIAYLLIGN
jgi:hypothetical protein